MDLWDSGDVIMAAIDDALNNDTGNHHVSSGSANRNGNVVDFEADLDENAAKTLGIQEDAVNKKRAQRIKFDENTLMNPRHGLPYIYENAHNKIMGISKDQNTPKKGLLNRKKLLLFYALTAHKMAPGIHFEDFMAKARSVGSRPAMRRIRRDFIDKERVEKERREDIEHAVFADNGLSLATQTTQPESSSDKRSLDQAAKDTQSSAFDVDIEFNSDDDDLFVSALRNNGDEDLFVSVPTGLPANKDNESEKLSKDPEPALNDTAAADSTAKSTSDRAEELACMFDTMEDGNSNDSEEEIETRLPEKTADSTILDSQKMLSTDLGVTIKDTVGDVSFAKEVPSLNDSSKNEAAFIFDLNDENDGDEDVEMIHSSQRPRRKVMFDDFDDE